MRTSLNGSKPTQKLTLNRLEELLEPDLTTWNYPFFPETKEAEPGVFVFQSDAFVCSFKAERDANGELTNAKWIGFGKPDFVKK